MYPHECQGAECPYCGPWSIPQAVKEERLVQQWKREDRECMVCPRFGAHQCGICHGYLCQNHSLYQREELGTIHILCQKCRGSQTKKLAGVSQDTTWAQMEAAYKVGIRELGQKLKRQRELLRSFRDSCGNPVQEWPRMAKPSATVIIVHGGHWEEGAPWDVVIHQRTDNRKWAFPSGSMEIGESIQACAIREAREETGLTVYLHRLTSVDSDPKYHAICQYPDGGCIQYCNLTFLAGVQSGVLEKSDESLDLRWCRTDQLPKDFLPLHRWRLEQAMSPYRIALPVR